MEAQLTADDIFEIAERIEYNSGQFYTLAAEMFGLGALSMALRKLAEMEDDHRKKFTDMRARLSSGEIPVLPLDPDDRAARYLKGLVRGKLFARGADPAAHLTTADTPRDVLLSAIGLEKETITFYLGLKAIVASPGTREAVDEIIEEEMNHIADLAAQLSRLETSSRGEC